MLIGIVSDIHADAEALSRVLAELSTADAILCAGDAVSEYEFCADTVALLADHGVRCIQGNHEAVLFGGRNPDYLEKCRRSFPAESLAFLADAPPMREFDFGGVRVLMTSYGPRRGRVHPAGQPASGGFRPDAVRHGLFRSYARAFGASRRWRYRHQSRLLCAAASAGAHGYLRHLRYRNAGSGDPPARLRRRVPRSRSGIRAGFDRPTGRLTGTRRRSPETGCSGRRSPAAAGRPCVVHCP